MGVPSPPDGCAAGGCEAPQSTSDGNARGRGGIARRGIVRVRVPGRRQPPPVGCRVLAAVGHVEPGLPGRSRSVPAPGAGDQPGAVGTAHPGPGRRAGGAAGGPPGGWYGIALGAAGLLAAPVALRVERPGFDEGPESTMREIGSALGFLLMGSLFAFGLMNIGPVIVKLLASDAEADAAGRFVNGVVIARIPLFLFQAVQASLLPRLSALASAGRLGDFRIGLKRLMVVVAGLAVAGTLVGAVVGPAVVDIMFPGADLGHRTMGLLAAGSGVYMLALACAQAVIALGGHRDQALGWGLGMVGLGVATWVASDDLFLRVEIGLLVGSLVAFLSMAVLLVRRLLVAGPLSVDSGDFIEALHDVPIEA